MEISEDNESGHQVFHSISGEFCQMPVKSNKYFQKVQKKVADSDPDPVASQEKADVQHHPHSPISLVLDLVGLQESANYEPSNQ